MRLFREAVEKVIDDDHKKSFYPKTKYEHNYYKDHEVLEHLFLLDSLRQLNMTGASRTDADTVINYHKSMIEKGQEYKIHPVAREFMADANENIGKGINPDHAFKKKNVGTDKNNKADKTNPPQHIFQITNRILNKGISLNKASELVVTESEFKVEPQQMRKSFQKHKMWRNIAYCKWRFDNLIKTKKDEVKWNKQQKKNLKRYWGWEVK